MDVEKIVFGHIDFVDGEEYKKFQYRFACILLLAGMFVTATFIAADSAGQSQLHPYYVWGGAVYCVVFLACYLSVRNHPDRLKLVMVPGAVVSFLLESIAFFYNTADELRVVWFAVSLPSTYLLIGKKAGWVQTIITIFFIPIANGYLDNPYSPSAIITMLVVSLYVSVVFHVYTAKSVSFHQMMVAANSKLSHMAARDPLTGLFNGRAYYAECERARSQAMRHNQPFAMLFVDLDHFKSINDRFGHEAGDAVLKAVALSLTHHVRQSDVIGRIGGEEFSVLLPNTDLDGGRQLAEKIRQELECLMPDIGTQCLRITASIGVAGGRLVFPPIATVQAQADQAMYHAKRQGRNRVTCVDDIAVPA